VLAVVRGVAVRARQRSAGSLSIPVMVRRESPAVDRLARRAGGDVEVEDQRLAVRRAVGGTNSPVCPDTATTWSGDA
jgi:hypothetical protein